MTREIAFKFWLGHTKKMTFSHSLQEVGKIIPEFTPDIIPLQYTGLDDINGIEIFEGDIVKWGHIKGGKENPVRIAVVKIAPDIQFVLIPKVSAFFGQDDYAFHFGSFAYTNTKQWMEVIGNIYQNPELLS